MESSWTDVSSSKGGNDADHKEGNDADRMSASWNSTGTIPLMTRTSDGTMVFEQSVSKNQDECKDDVGDEVDEVQDEEDRKWTTVKSSIQVTSSRRVAIRTMRLYDTSSSEHE